MIPVIGVPVLNRPELLEKMLGSIDDQVGRVVIIDNGDIVPNQDEYQVIRPGHNIGVAQAWNLIIKTTPWAAWWLIVNSDVEFRPGSLERFSEAVDENSPSIYHLIGYAAFALTPSVVAQVGFFDENFHPAYCEDDDYSRRCELAGVSRIQVPDCPAEHLGSATIYGDKRYMDRNGSTFDANVLYYEQKWGGAMHGGEMFNTPFDRGGSLKDWDLDIYRLRDQAWERTTD